MKAVASVERVDGAGGGLVEARLLWGKETLGIRHVTPRGALRVADLGLGLEEAAEIVVAEGGRGAIELKLPNGTAVPAGCRMSLKVGKATLRISLVADDVAPPPRQRIDARVAYGIIGAAALHLVVMGFVALGRAPAGVAEEAAQATMKGYMAAAEERALADLAAAQQKAAESEALAAAAAREERSAITSAKARDDAKARASKGEGARRVALTRAGSSERVEGFGLLAILAKDGARARTSAFAAERGPSSIGNVFRSTIDDAASIGGLGLSGAGEGGGGKGAGVPLGGIGALGKIDLEAGS
ncbi:MAG: hypothetical protein KF819_13745 [Labilithrix sp.]|nr:hypothetical protein [Labilithrix sp.]